MCAQEKLTVDFSVVVGEARAAVVRDRTVRQVAVAVVGWGARYHRGAILHAHTERRGFQGHEDGRSEGAVEGRETQIRSATADGESNAFQTLPYIQMSMCLSKVFHEGAYNEFNAEMK